jgi:hypothetical protein
MTSKSITAPAGTLRLSLLSESLGVGGALTSRRDDTVRLGSWRIAQAALYHGRAVKIVGVVKVTTGPLA